MSEIEELKSHIQKLKERANGQEMALINLVHAICDAGNIDLKRISEGFSKMAKVNKETFVLGEAAVPLDNICEMLAVSVEAVEKDLSKQDSSR